MRPTNKDGNSQMSHEDVNPVNPSQPKRVAIFWAGMVNEYLELCVVGTPVSAP